MTDQTVETGRQDTAGERRTGETGPAGDPRMTRREVVVGAGQVAVAGMTLPPLALLGGCATPQGEPWADGTFWTDGTGWVDGTGWID